MTVAPVLPIAIPLFTAALCLLAWGRERIQRWVSLAGVSSLFASAICLLVRVRTQGVVTEQIGSWPAPYGISLVADLLAAIMVLVSATVALVVAVYALAEVEPTQKLSFYPLYHVLLMGVCGAFLTGDLFNLFVWFELMLMASFVLLSLGKRPAQLSGAVKYVTLNFVASGLFLTGIGILYASTGTLNMAAMAVSLEENGGVAPRAASMLLLASFASKAALFPLFFWLPASYHTPPVTVSAVFAGLLTKVGVYALIRMFTLLFHREAEGVHGVILLLSVITMITGVLGATAQPDIRRVLSFHIISQIGYMTLGLGLFTPAALAASIFYIVHHIVVKTNLFLISGAIRKVRGTEELKHLGGLYQTHPWLALLFMIPALALAGIPPLSGFIAKFAVIRAGLVAEEWVSVAVALAVGLLTLISMTKIWAETFWKTEPESQRKTDKPVPKLMLGSITALALITVLLGLAPSLLFELATDAGQQLMHPQIYIDAVLGGW